MFVRLRAQLYSSAFLAFVTLSLAVSCGCGGNAGTSNFVPPAAPPPAPATGAANGAGAGSNTGGSTGSGPTTSPTPPPPARHVVVVMEENHSYSEVIGSPDMPYLNGVANQYGLATNYYGNAHPSLPNYFMMTAGDDVELNASDYTYTGPYDGSNVASVLTAAGKTWKIYAESIPNVGYTGGDVYPYIQHHNPFVYFSSVRNDPTQLQNVVPFSQFSADLAAGNLPSYSFIVPNLLDDAHDGTLAQADAWLKTNIDPLVTSSTFANTLLIIVFDESVLSDLANGGGHVAAVIAGGDVIPGFRSNTLYHHENALRLSMDYLGVSGAPGVAANVPGMDEFLK